MNGNSTITLKASFMKKPKEFTLWQDPQGISLKISFKSSNKVTFKNKVLFLFLFQESFMFEQDLLFNDLYAFAICMLEVSKYCDLGGAKELQSIEDIHSYVNRLKFKIARSNDSKEEKS